MAQRQCRRPDCQRHGLVKLRRTNLGRGNDREGTHHSVGVLLPDLRDQQCTHTSTGTTTKRVGNLETLETVGSLGLSSDNIENRVDKLGTFSVMTLCPIVTSTALAEDTDSQLWSTRRNEQLTSYQVGKGFLGDHLG